MLDTQEFVPCIMAGVATQESSTASSITRDASQFGHGVVMCNVPNGRVYRRAGPSTSAAVDARLILPTGEDIEFLLDWGTNETSGTLPSVATSSGEAGAKHEEGAAAPTSGVESLEAEAEGVRVEGTESFVDSGNTEELHTTGEDADELDAAIAASLTEGDAEMGAPIDDDASPPVLRVRTSLGSFLLAEGGALKPEDGNHGKSCPALYAYGPGAKVVLVRAETSSQGGTTSRVEATASEIARVSEADAKAQ